MSRSRAVPVATAAVALILLIAAIMWLTEPAPNHAATAPRLMAWSTAAAGSDSLFARRMWQNPYIGEPGGPSPDGRLLAYMEYGHGRLLVRDLDAGTERVLVEQSYLDDNVTGWPWRPIFAPDGSRIAYGWEASGAFQLRIIAADGGEPRVVHSATDLRFLSPEDWTADGQHVVAIATLTDETSSIVLIRVADGQVRTLKSFSDWRRPLAARISPDSRFIAYSFAPSKQDGQRDIYLLALDEARESTLVRNAADDIVVGWTPDGSHLVLSSDVSGSPALWLLPFAAGRATGEPTLLRRDMWRMKPLRITPRGHLVYTITTGDRNVYTAPFDAATGQTAAPPAALSSNPGEDYYTAMWSEDGRFVAYARLLTNMDGVGSREVTIRSLENGESRSIRPEVGYLGRFNWMPASRGLVLHGRDEHDRNTIFELDLQSGSISRLIDRTNMPPVFARDGRTLYYVGRPEGVTEGPATAIVARDMTSGSERRIYIAPAGRNIVTAYSNFMPNLALTPNGRTLLFAEPGPVLRALDVTTGAARDVMPDVEPGRYTNLRAVGFSPDGGHAYFHTRIAPVMTEAWFRVPVAGGLPQELEMPAAETRMLQLSPDGGTLLFVAGGLSEEVWVMTGAALGSPPAARAVAGTPPDA